MKEKISLNEKKSPQETLENTDGPYVLPEVKDIINKNEYIQYALAEICEYDTKTFEHTLRMANHITRLKNMLSEKEIDLLLSSTLVHDVGKKEVAHEIIIKKDKLTDEEYEKIKEHVRAGINYLKDVRAPQEVIAIMAAHHEHQGDRSYPRRDHSEEDEVFEGSDKREDNEMVEKLGRMLAIVDHFEAATADRPEKGSESFDQCREEMLEKFINPEDEKIINILTDYKK